MEAEKSPVIQPLNVLANCFEAINCNDKFRGYTDVLHCEQFEEMWRSTSKLRPQPRTQRMPHGLIPIIDSSDLIFNQFASKPVLVDDHTSPTMPILADHANADHTSPLISMDDEPIFSSSELTDEIYRQTMYHGIDINKPAVNFKDLTEDMHEAIQHDDGMFSLQPRVQLCDPRYPRCNNVRNQQKQTYMDHRIEDASYDLKRNQIADLILKIAGHNAVYVQNNEGAGALIYFIDITMEQYHNHINAIFNAVSKINYTRDEHEYYETREDKKSDIDHGIYILKNENAYTICAFNGAMTTPSIKIMHEIYPRIGTLFLNLPLINQIVYYYREPMTYGDIKITNNMRYRGNDHPTITDQLTATTSKLYAIHACAKLELTDRRYDQEDDFIVQTRVLSKSCELEDIIKLTNMITRSSNLSSGTKKINFYTMAQNKQKHMNVIIPINEWECVVKNHVCSETYTGCTYCCCQQMHEFVMRQYDGFNVSVDTIEDVIQQPKIAKLMFRDLYKEFALAAYVEEDTEAALTALQKQCNMYVEQSHQMVKNVLALGPTLANYRPRDYHDNVYKIINMGFLPEKPPCDAVITRTLMSHFDKFVLIYLVIMQHCELKEIVWNVIQSLWRHFIFRANRILNMWDVIPNLEVSEDITKCDDATFDQMCVNIWQQLVNDTARLEQHPQFNDGVDGVFHANNPLDDIDARMFNYANRPIVWGVN
jgi:hypothetical protein